GILITILLALALFVGASSCSDTFLTLSPTDMIVEDNFFLSVADAETALMGVYGVIQPEPGFTNVNDAADVEWSITGDMYEMDGSAGRVAIHSLALPATNGMFLNIYTTAYQGISRANMVISKVANME